MFDNYMLRLMIKEHGRTLTYRKKSEGTYNATTGKLNSITTTDYLVKGFFFDFDIDLIDGQLIQKTDRRLVLDTKLINGLDIVTPDTTDQIVGFQNPVNIQEVRIIESNGKVMCYLLHTRG